MEEGYRKTCGSQGETPTIPKISSVTLIIQTSHTVDSDEKNEYRNGTGTAPTPHNDDDETTYKADQNGKDKYQGSP